MRVITTWMYFDEDQIRGERFSEHRGQGRGEKPEPGIGIGWFAGDTTDLMTPIHNVKLFRPLRPRDGEQPLSVEVLGHYLDLFLMDADEYEFDRPERSMKHENVVEYVLS